MAQYKGLRRNENSLWKKHFSVGKNGQKLYHTYVSINVGGESTGLELTQELY